MAAEEAVSIEVCKVCEMVLKHNSLLYGNGEPGMKTQIALLADAEEKRSERDKQNRAMWLTTIGLLVANIIIQFVIKG